MGYESSLNSMVLNISSIKNDVKGRIWYRKERDSLKKIADHFFSLQNTTEDELQASRLFE